MHPAGRTPGAMAPPTPLARGVGGEGGTHGRGPGCRWAAKHLPPKEVLKTLQLWHEETLICLSRHTPPKKFNSSNFGEIFCRDVKKNVIYLEKKFEKFPSTGTIFFNF